MAPDPDLASGPTPDAPAQTTAWRATVRWLVGGALSLLTLLLAFRQVDSAQLRTALLRADYGLVTLAAALQLVVVAVIAGLLTWVHQSVWHSGASKTSRSVVPG
ncbi:MAG: hypothetical protein AB1505_35920 [Candidatus Latescibacterota bacterium]